MTTRIRGRNFCDYVSVAGKTCGKRVYYTRCFPHKTRDSHTVCTVCKVIYTRSDSGICSKGSCRKHNHKAARIKRDTPVEPEPEQIVLA